MTERGREEKGRKENQGKGWGEMRKQKSQMSLTSNRKAMKKMYK